VSFAAGHRFGRYEIRSLIGAGGMGEVYLAQDTKLERKVALKVLLGTATSSEDRLRRFAQEARAASALNHPNIVTVHDVDVEEGTRYITTEFVEGETLRARLRRGRLPLSEALGIAIQVADALAVAHREGIVHRDIKPENILLRPDGYVKVVDFGLAKLTEQADESDQTQVATRVAHDTDVGVVLGTVAYMSPEQARGLRVDQRSDVWSLGVVLYEMITGRRPFEGPTSSDIIARILHNDPPKVAPLVPEATGEIELVLETALAKDVDERYQTARDFLNALKRVRRHLDAEAEHRRVAPSDAPGSGMVSSPTPTPTPTLAGSALSAAPSSDAVRTQSSVEIITTELKRHRRLLTLATVGLVACLAFGGYAAYLMLHTAPVVRPFEHFRISRLTATGRVLDAVISPDGRYVVHTVQDPDGESLWVRQVKTDSLVNIVPTAPVRYTGIAFSPDGEYVYYSTRDPRGPLGVLYQVPVLGGAPRHVLDDVDTNVTFSPDGNRMAFIRGYPSEGSSSVVVVNADGTGERRLATLKRPKLFPIDPTERVGPSWSPDGRWIATPAGDERFSYVAAVDASTGAISSPGPGNWYAVRRVGWLTDSSAVLAAVAENSNHYLTQQVWVVPLANREVRRITNDLNNYAGMSTTKAGDAFVAVQIALATGLWIAPEGDSSRATALTSEGPSIDGTPGVTWTPGGRVVYVTAAVGGDIWSMNPNGSDRRPLVVNSAANVQPVVSPDGRFVVFLSDRAGTAFRLWRTGVDGSNPIQLTQTDSGPASFFPDGRTVAYSGDDGRVWRISIDGGTPARLLDVETNRPTVSPDGRFIACTYRPTQTARLQVAIYPSDGRQPLRTVDMPRTWTGTTVLRWSPDGRAVQFVDTRLGVSNIWQVERDTGAISQITHFKDSEIFNFAWSPDGKQLALSRGMQRSDAVLVTDEKAQSAYP
jgi:eukaryotic-like serine/threonine-protein kinase